MVVLVQFSELEISKLRVVSNATLLVKLDTKLKVMPFVLECRHAMSKDTLGRHYAASVWFSINKQRQHNEGVFLAALMWNLCVKRTLSG